MTIKVRIQNYLDSKNNAIVISEMPEPTGELDRIELPPGDWVDVYVWRNCSVKVIEGDKAIPKEITIADLKKAA